MERIMGLEPTRSAWRAEMLPLHHIRVLTLVFILIKIILI